MVQTVYQDLEITDFSGGITDKYVDGMPNEARQLDNFILNEVGLPEFRYGTKVVYDQETIQRIMGLFLLDDNILAFRGQQMWEFDNVSALSQVTVPNVVQPFFQVTANDIYPAVDEWRNQLLVTNSGQTTPSVDLNFPMLVYKNELGNTVSHEVGLPDYEDNAGATFTPNGSAGTAKSYLYRFNYIYEYNVGTTVFRTVGFTRQFEYTQQYDIDATNFVSIENFDVISPVGNQIDVANVKIQVSRTKDVGTVFYNILEADLGQAFPLIDLVKDEDLESFASNYTTGGVVNHSKPPKCRFGFVVNDTAYYCSVIETVGIVDEFRPYRFVQSIPSNITGVYDSAFTDLDDDITGGNSVNGLPIIFTKSYIYRIEGAIDSTGAGVVRPRVISDTIGCVSHRSIINVGKKLYFAGNDGFYVTDGYQIDLLTKRLVNRYRGITANNIRAERITATYDNTEERIYWAVGDNDSENNLWWCLNLKTGGFTTGSGISFQPTSLIERDGSIFRGDDQGYIYEHNQTLFSDVIRDALTPSSEWETTHIPFDLETVAYNFGSTSIRKWVSTATITTKTATKLGYGITSINDDGDKRNAMKEVRIFDRCFWDDVNCIWDNAEIFWKSAGTQSKQRHFPRRHARCHRKQVKIIPAKVIRFKSDLYEQADVTLVDPLDPTQFLVTLPAGEWPDEIVGDEIRFGDDSYANTYTIESRTASSLVCRGGGLVPSTGKDWDIYGYNREQRAEIKGISIKFTLLSRQGNKFQSQESGGNS